MVLIDNTPHWFKLHLNNGYPMLPFFHDRTDTELIHLTHFLKKLSQQNDVRKTLKNTFWLNKLKRKEISDNVLFDVECNYDELEEQDYNDWSRLIPYKIFNVTKTNDALLSTLFLDKMHIKSKNMSDRKPSGLLMKKGNYSSHLSISTSSFVKSRNNKFWLTAEAKVNKKLLHFSVSNEMFK